MKLEKPDQKNLTENSTPIATGITNNKQNFNILFNLIHSDPDLTDAAYMDGILHKNPIDIFEFIVNECLEQKNYRVLAQTLLLTNNLKLKGLNELTIEPKISENLYNRLQDIHNKKVIVANNNLQQQQQNTFAQLTTLLETTEKTIEQLLSDDKQQRMIYNNAFDHIDQDSQNAFACIQSISEKHIILPPTDQPLPTSVKNTANLEILIPTLAAIRKASEAINNHLLLPENAHLAIENKK